MAANNPARIAFLRREAARDIDAEVAAGADRAWVTRQVAEAREELAILEGRYQPTSPVVERPEPAAEATRWAAEDEAEAARMGRILRQAARRGLL